RSRRSGGPRRRCSGPATPAHQPAAASQRSLQACTSSSALQSSFMSKDILQVGPLFRGRTIRRRALNLLLLTCCAHSCAPSPVECRWSHARKRSGQCWLVEYHHLGDEGLDVADVRQTATSS